ncbi:MAG: hypothetical protein AAFW73_17810 [Bacteroidota bacterium]
MTTKPFLFATLLLTAIGCGPVPPSTPPATTTIPPSSYPELLSSSTQSENVFSFTRDERSGFQTRTTGWEWQRGRLFAIDRDTLLPIAGPSALDSIYNGAISPSGDRLIYCVKVAGEDRIYLLEKGGGAWSEPIDLSGPSGIRGGYFFWWSEEDLYFYVPTGEGDLVRAKLVDRTLTIVDRLEALNSPAATEFSPYVDPDKSFIVFSRYQEGDETQQGFFISYHTAAGDAPRWSPPQKIERLPYGWNPYFVAGGTYFLYSDGEDIRGLPRDSLGLVPPRPHFLNRD